MIQNVIKKIQTFKTVSDLSCQMEDYSYQKNITPELDELDGDFDQSIINEIVLWKVNRYTLIAPETLLLLNQIGKQDRVLDEELTRKILAQFLSKGQKGIRLAMASTILRFKNPHIYQIIDQRVYRFIYGEELIYYSSDIDEQTDTYLNYLKKLHDVCLSMSISFSEADRILYLLDKKWNSKIKLK